MVASPTLTIGKLTLDSLYLTATFAPFRKVNVERLPPDIVTSPLVAVRSVVFGTVSSLIARLSKFLGKTLAPAQVSIIRKVSAPFCSIVDLSGWAGRLAMPRHAYESGVLGLFLRTSRSGRGANVDGGGGIQ